MNRTLKVPAGTSATDKSKLQIKAAAMNLQFSIAVALLEEASSFFKEYGVFRHNNSQLASTLLAKVQDQNNQLNRANPLYSQIAGVLANQVQSFIFFTCNAVSPEQMLVYGAILESIVKGEYQMTAGDQRDLVLEKAQLVQKLLQFAQANPTQTDWLWPILADHNITRDYILHPLDVIYALIVKDKIVKPNYIEDL
jgi:hypothetical protein